MYVLTNTKIAGTTKLMPKYFLVLAIMVMVSAKSYVNGRKEKVCFCQIWFREWQKHTHKLSRTYRPSLYWTRLGFQYLISSLDYVKIDFISKSFLLTLDFPGRLIEQYTQHTLYITQKHTQISFKNI